MTLILGIALRQLTHIKEFLPQVINELAILMTKPGEKFERGDVLETFFPFTYH